MQRYVIKFVSDLRQVGSFFSVFSINKTDCHDITEILLKVEFNNITLASNTLPLSLFFEKTQA